VFCCCWRRRRRRRRLLAQGLGRRTDMRGYYCGEFDIRLRWFYRRGSFR
jgi:hypothetical protein